MRKIVHNKLVRDNIPKIIKANGEEPRTKRLSPSQFKNALREKLVEEAHEVKDARTRHELVYELSDIMEVMHAIAKNNKISMSDIEKARKKKALERGGFDKRVFLQYTFQKRKVKNG